MAAGLLSHTASASASTPGNSTLTASDTGFIPVSTPTVGGLQGTLAGALNAVIDGGGPAAENVYNPAYFEGVTFSAATDAYLAQFDAISLNAAALATGDAVVYHAGAGGTVPGLTDGSSYYVIKIDDGAIRLAASYADALAGTFVKITAGATGNAQSFTLSNVSGAASVTFDASTVTASGTQLTFASADGLSDGESVLYSAGGGTAITGLTDGAVYQVHVLGPATIELTVPGSGLGAYLTLGVGATGKSQSFTAQTPGTVSFNASQATVLGAGQLHFTTADGLVEGEQVLYSAAGGTPIGGLRDGVIYQVHIVDAQTIELLAPGTGIYLPLSAGAGAGQSFTEIVQFAAGNINTTFPTGSDLGQLRSLTDNDAYGATLINASSGSVGPSFSGFISTLETVAQQSFSAGGVQPSELDLLGSYLSRRGAGGRRTRRSGELRERRARPAGEHHDDLRRRRLAVRQR